MDLVLYLVFQEFSVLRVQSYKMVLSKSRGSTFNIITDDYNYICVLGFLKQLTKDTCLKEFPLFPSYYALGTDVVYC